ncbi:DEAD/DEAH box helicase [Mycolicibacterium frederiksbergense]|nr:DEAD/DEAH box helicase [Mycolicibacterium frederiksbergense]MDO0978024.1 DEAD/DEAH box helicase [Mycolicibacterium frederiksbergense]
MRAWTRRGKTSERLTAAKATPTTHMTSPDLTAPETPDVDVTVPETKPAISFAELGVRDEIVRALAETGKEHAFAIQELTLPLALAGDDLIGQARTGMGKTLAFGVPLLHRITSDGGRPLNGTPRALIVVPTRELCLQVYSDLELAAKYLRVDDVEGHTDRKFVVTSIYGGRPYEPQIEALRKGVDVVVGTPGRLLDLAQQGHLQLGSLSVLVLDEADEMLDLGFLPDIERILRLTPDDRQSMLFSATMPGPIITLARTFMNQPTHIRAEAPQSSQTHDTTEQFAYRAHALDKVEMVGRILQAEGRGATMIFTRTKRTAQKVADELAERGFKVGAVHGDLGQIAREKALKAFRTGEVDVLVATDVAARGIDIDDITHVINYQIPEDEQAYVHRIGRTGRAGKTGIAVTLVDWDELPRWTMIDKALGLDNPDPVETYSSSPHLFEELKIPTDATGSIAAPRKTKTRTEGERTERVERTERPARNRNRTRQRTRAGQPATGHPEGESAPQDSTEGPAADAGQDSEGTDAPAKRRRRRRPRKTSSPAAG